MKKIIPQATLERLPLYCRTLGEMLAENVRLTSSIQLGERLEISSVQIRKDLAYCGNFGLRGMGYDVEALRRQIKKLLGMHYKRRVAIVGAGHLGTALASYEKFSQLNFTLAAFFDNDKRIIGSEINDVKVYDAAKMESIARRKIIDVGVIAIPKEYAQSAADTLIAAGVKGIWNFAPTKIFVPEDVTLVNEDFVVSLSSLSYHITRNEG